MICRRFVPRALEELRRLFDFLTRRAIHDPRFSLHFFEERNELARKIFPIGDLIEEVRTVEGRDETERVAKLQGALHVFSDKFRRRRRERRDGTLRK